MILTFQLPPNEVAQSTSEVDFLSSYLNQTTSEENIRTRHTRIRARHIHKFCVFCLHFLHLLGHPLKISPLVKDLEK